MIQIESSVNHQSYSNRIISSYSNRIWKTPPVKWNPFPQQRFRH